MPPVILALLARMGASGLGRSLMGGLGGLGSRAGAGMDRMVPGLRSGVQDFAQTARFMPSVDPMMWDAGAANLPSLGYRAATAANTPLGRGLGVVGGAVGLNHLGGMLGDDSNTPNFGTMNDPNAFGRSMGMGPNTMSNLLQSQQRNQAKSPSMVPSMPMPGPFGAPGGQLDPRIMQLLMQSPPAGG